MADSERKVIKMQYLGSLNELANGLGLNAVYIQTHGQAHYTNTYTLDLNINGEDVRFVYEESLPYSFGVHVGV